MRCAARATATSVQAPLAVIARTANAATYASKTFPLTNPGGLDEPFLVFRPVAGVPGNDYFDLNRVQLEGAGISDNQ